MRIIALLLAVLIGFSFVAILKPRTKIIQLLLSFSGAYLLSITVLHLIPDVFETQQDNIGIFILLGILLQTILEFFSKGAEHGHIHKKEIIKKTPWLIFISLGLHAFLEGIPLGFENNSELLSAIVVHKVPITIVLVVFLKQSNLSKTSIYLFVLAFSLMSPLGSVLADQFNILVNFETEINAIIIGIFLHISTAILFESSENHQFNYSKFIAIITGFLIAMIH